MLPEKHFHSNAKVLLSAEYFVLYGAKALALPLKAKQELYVKKDKAKQEIAWKAKDTRDFLFQAKIDTGNWQLLENNNKDIALHLLEIFKYISQRKPKLFSQNTSYIFDSNIHWPISFGLGSSSTLMANLAQWSALDAYKLNRHFYQGSGYDIACSFSSNPLFYELKSNKQTILNTEFNPLFKSDLLFVYLNKKQTSLNSIQKIKSFPKPIDTIIERINELSEAFSNCQELKTFQKLMKEHEQLVAAFIKQKPIKEVLFPDFDGEIKSLGAWGGDFILAAGNQNSSYSKNYFAQKGFYTSYNFNEIIENELIY